jgi:hypothetical protein
MPIGESGKTDPEWPENVATAKGQSLVIQDAQLEMTIMINLILPPYTTRERVIEHEKQHADRFAAAWNENARELNAYQGNWCSAKCAELAASYVRWRGSFNFSKAMVAELLWDIAEAQTDATRAQYIEQFKKWQERGQGDGRMAAEFAEKLAMMGCRRS